MALDYLALGFTFTTADAADALRKTEAEVHDLIRTGMLPFLVLRDDAISPPRLWFHADEVRRVEVRLRRAVVEGGGLAVDDRNRLRVQAALRAYLAAVPPERLYDVAMTRNAPLLGKARDGVECTHVRPEAVAAFGSTLDRVPVTLSMVRSGLEFFGALRVRGVTAAGEPGKQRWGVWYRLPPGFAPGDDDEPEVIAGVLDGALRPGDRVTRRGMGPAQLVEPLTGAGDAETSDVD